MENSSGLQSPGSVSLDQVLRVAELAQLELTADEQTAMLRDLNSVLGHVAQLNELDTAEVPAMAQVSEMLHAESTPENPDPSTRSGQAMGHGNDDVLRSDTLCASLDRKEVMAAAPDTDGTYFKVPKVIER